MLLVSIVRLQNDPELPSPRQIELILVSFSFLKITHRSSLLSKGNRWRFDTHRQKPVLYNCPEMHSWGGARGSKLTTNIITV